MALCNEEDCKGDRMQELSHPTSQTTLATIQAVGSSVEGTQMTLDDAIESDPSIQSFTPFHSMRRRIHMLRTAVTDARLDGQSHNISSRLIATCQQRVDQVQRDMQNLEHNHSMLSHDLDSTAIQLRSSHQDLQDRLTHIETLDTHLHATHREDTERLAQQTVQNVEAVKTEILDKLATETQRLQQCYSDLQNRTNSAVNEMNIGLHDALAKVESTLAVVTTTSRLASAEVQPDATNEALLAASELRMRSEMALLVQKTDAQHMGRIDELHHFTVKVHEDINRLVSTRAQEQQEWTVAAVEEVSRRQKEYNATWEQQHHQTLPDVVRQIVQQHVDTMRTECETMRSEFVQTLENQRASKDEEMQTLKSQVVVLSELVAQLTADKVANEEKKTCHTSVSHLETEQTIPIGTEATTVTQKSIESPVNGYDDPTTTHSIQQNITTQEDESENPLLQGVSGDTQITTIVPVVVAVTHEMVSVSTDTPNPPHPITPALRSTVQYEETADAIPENISRREKWTRVPISLAAMTGIEHGEIKLTIHAMKTQTSDNTAPTGRLSGKRMQEHETQGSDSLVDESLIADIPSDASHYVANLPAEQESIRSVRLDASNESPQFQLLHDSQSDGVSILAEGCRLASVVSGYEMEVKRSVNGHLQLFVRRNIRRLPARAIRPGLWTWEFELFRL